MITQNTKGVQVSVRSVYQGSFFQKDILQHAFSYNITITNHTDLPIQIDSRYWEIIDSLQATKIVQGQGIIGQQPIIDPLNSHSYTSGCILHSTIGVMTGYYNVVCPLENRTFKVRIPRFKLIATYAMN
ncbi:Co2+/Mg2+ efflux protein ApaG [Myroides sp. LJL119]